MAADWTIAALGLDLFRGTWSTLPSVRALLAQLVEQLTLNQRVEGSSPSGGIFEIRRTLSQSVAFPRTIQGILSVGRSEAISQTVALCRNRRHPAVLRMLGQMLGFLEGVREAI